MSRTKKAWKLTKDRYAYITPKGARGIASTLKEAKRKAGSNPGSKSKATKPKTKPRKRRNPTMAKKKNRKTRSFKVPLATTIGLLQATNAFGAWGSIASGQYGDALEKIGAGLTGYSTQTHDWKPGRMANGLLPLVIGALISKFVGGAPLNLNKKLKDIPFIKI